MRTRTIRAAVQEPPELEAVAVRMSGRLWCWIEEKDLFFRIPPGSVPEDFVHQPPDGGFFEALIREPASKVALPSRAGDRTTIGGVPITDEKVMAMVEKSHGVVTWGHAKDWFVARSSAGETVALWKMPKNHHMHDVAMVEFEGDPWALSAHFAMRLRPPAAQRAKMLETATQNPSLLTNLAKMIAAGRAGRVVQARGSEGEVVTVGPSRYPWAQIAACEAHVGKGVEWRWTGDLAPLAGFQGDLVVALVMPLAPLAPEARPS